MGPRGGESAPSALPHSVTDILVRKKHDLPQMGFPQEEGSQETPSSVLVRPSLTD